jgi:uridine phosphorylase
MATPIHLHPTAQLADRVLLPGDPGRALLLAQTLLDEPRMFNHNRGLWGYTGTAADGAPMTIQSTGMGGPSAAIVINELADLGARRLVRVGTCGALDSALALGDLLIATESIAADGTSRGLGAPERVGASPELLEALLAAGDGIAAAGPVASTDLFYDRPPEHDRAWRSAGARAFEMEAATLFVLAARRDLAAAAVLVVAATAPPDRVGIDPEALKLAEARMGELAARALPAG